MGSENASMLAPSVTGSAYLPPDDEQTSRPSFFDTIPEESAQQRAPTSPRSGGSAGSAQDGFSGEIAQKRARAQKSLRSSSVSGSEDCTLEDEQTSEETTQPRAQKSQLPLRRAESVQERGQICGQTYG